MINISLIYIYIPEEGHTPIQYYYYSGICSSSASPKAKISHKTILYFSKTTIILIDFSNPVYILFKSQR